MDNQDLPKISDYKFLKVINSGGFGYVWEAKELKSNKIFAIKCENTQVKDPKLKHEYDIYNLIQKYPLSSEYIPKVYCYIEDSEEQTSALILDKLGPTLDDLFEMSGKKFPMKTILMLAIDMINILEFIHETGITHNDIKPNNFMFRDRINKLNIVDFGLSNCFYDSDGKHISCELGPCPTGTSLFSSIRVHWGVNSGRRDDLASLSYILLYFLRGNLPWDHYAGDWREILNIKKKMFPGRVLFDGYPKAFEDFFNCSENLCFDEKPDYERMRNLFFELAKNLNIILDFHYDF